MTIISTAIGTAIIVADPTVKVALITGICLVVAQFPAFILGYLILRQQRITHAVVDEVKFNTDGINTALQAKIVVQGQQLANKSDQAAHAEGFRAGSEDERAREGNGKQP